MKDYFKNHSFMITRKSFYIFWVSYILLIKFISEIFTLNLGFGNIITPALVFSVCSVSILDIFKLKANFTDKRKFILCLAFILLISGLAVWFALYYLLKS